jgi:hypothetical protein
MSQDDYTPFELFEQKKTESDRLTAIMNVDLEFLKTESEKVKVTCEDSARTALSMAMQTRKLGNTLEKTRKEILKPNLDYQRDVNKLVKEFQATLDQIEFNMQAQLSFWMNEQASNPFTVIDELQVDDGSIAMKKVWGFSIDDPDLVPDEYLAVDEDLIKEAVKNGVRNIKGVRIFQTTQTSMRVKN